MRDSKSKNRDIKPLPIYDRPSFYSSASGNPSRSRFAGSLGIRQGVKAIREVFVTGSGSSEHKFTGKYKNQPLVSGIRFFADGTSQPYTFIAQSTTSFTFGGKGIFKIYEIDE